MDFWRSEPYMKFFEFLDKKGGFYYEVCGHQSHGAIMDLTFIQRWGDAPVHSIGAALFARKDQLHFFDDIGTTHTSPP